MMRLIDADVLKKAIEECADKIQPKMQGRRNGKTLAYSYLTGLALVQKMIEEQPTAYDPVSVIEEMKECTIEHIAFGICSKYVEIGHASRIVMNQMERNRNAEVESKNESIDFFNHGYKTAIADMRDNLIRNSRTVYLDSRTRFVVTEDTINTICNEMRKRCK